jgi:hypothetical protein
MEARMCWRIFTPPTHVKTQNTFWLRMSYRLGIISLAHALVHVTDFPVVNVHVDELSSARIWQHKLCATLFKTEKLSFSP